MSISAFLSAVLPTEGFYCITFPAGEQRKHKHLVVKTIEEAAAKAKLISDSGYDAYFAIGALKQPRIIENCDGAQRVRIRVKENIRALRVVALDIDVDPKGESDKKYKTKEEAIAATIKFFKLIGWPAPLVVGSGNGLHLYVLLQSEVSPAQYQDLMRRFKAAAQCANYKFDSACTDVTRVLRVAGTYNYKQKDNPKPVKVLRWEEKRVDYQVLLQKLEDFLSKQNVKVPTVVHSVPDYLASFGNNLYGYVSAPLDYKRLIESCAVLRNFDEVGGHVSYQYWLHALQVIRHCEDGRGLAHAVSSRSSKYEKAATDKLLDNFEAKAIRPTLCATFAGLQETASFCELCPHRGKIRTPAVLGRDEALVKKEKERAKKYDDLLTVENGDIPDPPKPFMLTKDGIVKLSKSKEGEIERVVIYPYPVLPVRRVFSERTQAELLVWRTENPSDGQIEVTIDSADLYDKRLFATALAKLGIYVDLKYLDDLRSYMIGYAREMQRLYRRDLMVSRVGWRDDFGAFVHGTKLYKRDRVENCLTDMADRVRNALISKGSLDGWKKIISFYNDPQFAPHQFALGTAFGSVLMPFTGISGGIINLVGQSGEGKSTVQKIVNSVWGHPLQLMLPAEEKSSTYNAKVSFINQMNNLPICAEEITNASTEEVGLLAYSITQGSEKWRAGRDGMVKESLGGWCTTMLSSSNSSLYEKLNNASGAVAKALRIFEYRVPHVRIHDRATFREGVDLALLQHYGVAGDVYLRHLMSNLDRVKQLVIDTMAQIDTVFELRAEERVWSALIATNMVGLKLAKECGLIQFDLRQVWRFIDATIKQLRSTIEDLAPAPIDTLSRFVTEHIDQMLIVETQKNKSVFLIQKPRSQLALRYDVVSKRLAVSVASLQQWCRSVGIGFSELLVSLTQANVAVRKRRIYLSSGTDYPQTQVRCVEFDLSQISAERVVSIDSNIQGRIVTLPRKDA